MNLPKGWDEITLKKYQELSEISLIDMDEIDKMAKIIAVLSGETEDAVLDLPISDIKNYSKQIQFVFTAPEVKGIKQSIKLAGKKFRVNNKLSDLTGGEYIDLSEYTKATESITGNLHNIVAIFLHPETTKGNYIKNPNGDMVQTLKSRTANAELIKEEMMMTDVFMLSGFFLKVWESLMQTTQHYLIQQGKIAMKSLQQEMVDS